jgi:hypothetical protein
MRRYIIFTCLLTSCAVLAPTPALDTKPPLHLSDPPALKLKTVEFVVVHKDNAEKTFSDLEKNGQEPVLFALTGKDYKSLAVNTLQIKNYVKNQRKIIRLYRKYYEGSQNDKRKE